MNKNILIAGLIIAVVGYLFINNDPYPDEITFQNHLLNIKENQNNSLNPEIDIYSFSDSSRRHVLVIASVAGSSTVTLPGLTEQYVNRFTSQGMQFIRQGEQLIGQKPGIAMFVVASTNKDRLLIYSEPDNSSTPPTFSDSGDIFRALESLPF